MALIGSSTSSTPQWKWKYHVFLSFRGGDTRKNFTDHLHAALQRARIVTFRDEEDVERGEVISEELNKAIEESLLAIVILSHNYASSSWCLNELQKIVESRNDSSSSLGHQTILPVFYDIDPSDVRYQKGSIGRAFEKHEKRYTQEKVQRWRQALTYVANLLGWDTRNKHEAGIIEDITASVWNKLRDKLRDEVPSNFDNLVGIETKANTLISMLNIRSVDKCFMGIWGMGGIGKTTLARVVFDGIKSKFQASCFLSNIREESERNGLVYLQKELFLRMYPGSPILINDSHEGVMALKVSSHDKRVCIVLDDISHISQLENLAGNKEWFGDGSRIIVTTRDKHLLTSHGQYEKYEIEMLNKNESLELLCQKAFKKKCPEEGYVELSEKVVEYAGGLPLALQVLGSFLCKRSQSEWRDTLDKLKKILHRDIFKILRLSYDGLEDKELQKLFLDIACFFNWEEKDKVTKRLQNCGHHSIIGISVLIEKSLLSLKVGKDGVAFLYMHDLLQEMGRNIVLENSPNYAGRHSRLWSQWQVDQVLTREKGTDEIQGIGLKLQQQFNANWHPNCFSNLPNLKLLYLRDVSLSNSLSSLPIALKVLIWKSYPLQSLPQNIDQLYELVELELRYSRITHLWSGKPILGNLKFINLSHSIFLIQTPDFSGVPNLESLFLQYCTSLVKVHESVGQLKKLVKLSLRHCTNLVTLPWKLEMDSLEELDLTRCTKLERLPESGKNMNRLSIFEIRVCYNINKIPSSIIQLTNLKELSFRGCGWRGWYLEPMGLKFPDSLSGLSLLRKLDLSWCTLVDGSIPNDLSGLTSLKILDLSKNNFVRLPIECISNLVNLEHFDVHGCGRLQSMPHLPPNLLTVDASGCSLMKAITDLQVQDLFASLLSKLRCIVSDEVIILLISENAIPITLFKRQQCSVGPFGNSVCVRVDIPNIDEDNEWLGIAVCLKVECKEPDEVDVKYSFWWSFRDFEDKSFSQENRKYYKRFVHPEPHLFVAFFPFEAQNNWQHYPRGEHPQLLEIEFDRRCDYEIKECGWRLICKKDASS